MSTTSPRSTDMQTNGSDFRAVTLFSGMSVAYFRRNMISLVMTLAIPVVFLLLYSYAYYLSAPATRVGVVFDTTVPLLASELKLDEEAFNLRHGAEDAIQDVRREKARIGISRLDAETVQIAAYRMDRPLVAILAQRIGMLQPELKVQPLWVDAETSPLFFLPAIIIMSLLNLGLFTTGAKVLQERSASTLRLYRMLPLPFWTYFAAEFLTKLLLAVGITLVFLLCAVALLDTGLGLDRWLLTLVASIPVAAAFVSFGLAIACLLPNYSSGVHVFTVVNLVIVFFGDLFFPASKFPLTEAIARVMPTSYSVDLFKGLILNTEFRIDPWVSVGFLLIFAAVMFLIAITSFKYTAKE